MPNIVITGAQWGDEGKGKIVDLLAPKVQVVARYNGGHNAGHTVIVGERKFVLHLVPSGILHAGVLNVIGNGTVIDLWSLEKELEGLEKAGIEVGDNLLLSDRAHLILPHHRSLEGLAEELRGSRKLGTTHRGIGPCYEDKAGRRGLTLGDLRRPHTLPAKLEEARRHYEQVRRGAGREPEVDWDALFVELEAFGLRLRDRIADVSLVLHRQMANGYSVLFEGAQAILLDLDFGTYPFVSSSSAGVGGVSIGLGVPPSRIDGVIGVVKAYTTRVGTGPFPTEDKAALGEHLRARGGEFGATTGRPRRCGWFDAVIARYAVRVNGFDTLALTKLDVLDELDEIQVCTGYRHEGETLAELPSDVTVLEACEPCYEKLPGWKTSTAGMREFGELPKEARAYVERLEELVGCGIGMVSTSPERDDTILRRNSPIASWFA